MTSMCPARIFLLYGFRSDGTIVEERLSCELSTLGRKTRVTASCQGCC